LNAELEKSLDAKPKHTGIVIESPVVVIPDACTNTLIVSAKSPHAEKVAALIKRFDVPAKQVKIQATLTVTDASGKKSVLSRPQVITLDGQKAIIEIGDASGAGIQLELTPEVLPVAENTKAGAETTKK
jgi:type II secretory pathway component GspD/PulD (secretin)